MSLNKIIRILRITKTKAIKLKVALEDEEGKRNIDLHSVLTRR
jgi:hypothetical protein